LIVNKIDSKTAFKKVFGRVRMMAKRMIKKKVFETIPGIAPGLWRG
jgi:hypothetical protein